MFKLGGFSGSILENEPLSRHTYFQIGGPAEVLLQPQNEADLRLISKLWQNNRPRLTILGAGSNVLIADQGIKGWVIKTDKLNRKIEFDSSCVRAGACVAIGSLIREATRQGYGGVEWMVGIPGTVGGLVAMNAGTFLGEAKDAILEAEIFDLETGLERFLKKDRMRFSYRANHFLKSSEVVLAAQFALVRGEAAALQEKIQALLKRRKDAQPVDQPCCGSVFKNPPGQHAWQVIDKLGLRGHQIGQAQISTKHTNFIVNLGGAKASDVRALIDLIQGRAKDEMGITLEPEVKFLGD